MKASIAAMAAAPILALAQTTHDVDVGNGGYVFSPDTLMAADGDVINFHFYNPGQHSVALSTFDAPCVPDMSNQVFSGYVTMPPTGESDMVFQLTVNGTDPLFLYCTQGSHCQSGMAMAVNPSGSNTLAAYKMAAVDTTSQDLSMSPVGGLFIMADAGSSGSSSSSSSAAAMSTSSMAMSTSSMAMSSSMSMSGGAVPTGTMSSSEGMMPTSASAAPMQTTGAAVQVKGAAGAAALGLLGALFV